MSALAAFLAGGIGGAVAYAISQGKPVPTEAQLLDTLKEVKPLLTQTISLDCSVARDNQKFAIAGHSIFVVNPQTPTVPVYIRLNEPAIELIELTAQRSIRAPFYRFFITNAVGVGTLTIIVNKVSTVELEAATLEIDIASSGIMMPVDIQAQYIDLDINIKKWGGTALTGRNITTDIAKLDVALSTRASQTTLASILARLNITTSALRDGIITGIIAGLADPEISQPTPEDLKHVPHGWHAGSSTYKPLAVDVDGVLLTSSALGDMLKAIYDTNDDGVVDDSELLEGSTKAEVQDHTPAEHGNEAHNPDFIKVEEITTVASGATPTPTGGSLRNFYSITALAINATFAAPSGTPASANRLIVRIKDNGTARTLGWNAIYRALEWALPTTTVINKTLYLGFIYNSTDSKWDMLAINEEA